MSKLHPISGCENNERKADVIFIHGLGGDAFMTWCHGTDQKDSWPYWIGQRFPEVGVWSLGYAASPTKLPRGLKLFSKSRGDAGYSMALPDRALQVLDLMVQRNFGQRPIMFICHSLGGLLAKQILRKADDATDDRKRRIASQARAILFLATPHAGAKLASLLDAFRVIFATTVSIEDLRAHDAHLRDLYDWYRNRAPVLGLETVTYYEMRPVKGVMPIVTPTSAHPGVGSDPVPLDEDHISIAKPGDQQAQVCIAAFDLLRNHVFSSHFPRPPESQVAILPKVDPSAIDGKDTSRIPPQLHSHAVNDVPRPLETPKIKELQRIESLISEDMQQSPDHGNENSRDPYLTLNEDREIKETIRKKIQMILNKDLLKEVRENLCCALCKSVNDTAAKRLAEILVDLPVLDAIIKVEDAVREFFDPTDMTQKEKEKVFPQWQLCMDIMGWLLLLTVNPEWRNKHRSIFSNESSLNFKLSVTNKSAADVAVAGVMETPADMTRSSIKRLYGCCDIGVELGIFPADTAGAIAKCIYRALFDQEPDVSNDGYLKVLDADLLAYAKRNRLRYLTIDSNHRDNPLNDEATFRELKKILPNLSVIHIGIQGNGVDVFLIPELHVMANIRRFLEIGAQLKGV